LVDRVQQQAHHDHQQDDPAPIVQQPVKRAQEVNQPIHQPWHGTDAA